jgi:hypothetical protein
MKDREKLAQLKMVSQVMLDVRLLALDQAARARQESLDHLAALNQPATQTDLNPVVAGEVAMRYENWADHRRAEINLVLARQTVDWAEARQSAALAFGRNAVIGKLQNR